LDGIISIALLKRKFGEKLHPILATYKNIRELVKQSLSESPDQLFISDLSIGEDLMEILPQILESKSKITWFDHHYLPEEVKKTIQKSITFIHSKDEFVAAESIEVYFFKDDDIAKKIAKYAHISDNKISRTITDKLQLIIEGLQGDTPKLLKLIDYLKDGITKNQWIENEHERIKTLYQSEYDKIIDRTQEHDVNGIQLILSWSNIVSASRIAQYFVMTKDPELAIGVNTETGQVNLKSKKYPVTKIARDFGGGGHEFRAGFIFYKELLVNNTLSKEFLDILFSSIKKHGFNL